jgi:arginyl-tRNA synthetase
MKNTDQVGILTYLQTCIASTVVQEFGIELPADQVEITNTADPKFGDYATNIALKLSKELGLNPREIANKLLTSLQGQKEHESKISRIEAAGPGFINFFIAQKYYIDNLSSILNETFTYGFIAEGKQTYVVEHTSPNPNKAMHLGHLRNNLVGMSVANLFESQGIKVVRDCIDNNRGIAIAKLMWGYLQMMQPELNQEVTVSYWFDHQTDWPTPESMQLRPDKFVDMLYIQGADACKKSEDVEAKVRQLVIDWESKDPQVWALWQKVLDYSYQGQTLTLSRLGNKWDNVWHEHEHYQQGKDLVEVGLAKGIFKKDEGAVITQLDDYNIPNTVVIKSDGTSLYITQDLALTKLKKEKFKADKFFWVIGPEQSLALKQMFAVCEQLGIGKMEDFTHIAYGYMSIKGQGKMSSRSGNVVYIDDLLDQGRDLLEQQFKKEYSEAKEIDYEKLAIAAVKFSILKVSRTMDIAFDFEESMSFEGFSGPYIMYGYVRAKSILKNSGLDIDANIETNGELNESEIQVLKKLSLFPYVAADATENLAPHKICSYLFELTQSFNQFYKENKVLVDDIQVKTLRLQITQAVSIVLNNGLKLLAIDTIEQM